MTRGASAAQLTSLCREAAFAALDEHIGTEIIQKRHLCASHGVSGQNVTQDSTGQVQRI